MRISFLMLPATMLEKYVARFLMATLGFIIAAIVGMLFGRGYSLYSAFLLF